MEQEQKLREYLKIQYGTKEQALDELARALVELSYLQAGENDIELLTLPGFMSRHKELLDLMEPFLNEAPHPYL